MDTEAGFVEGALAQLMASNNRAGKRKRPAAEPSAPARASPMTRRTAASNGSMYLTSPYATPSQETSSGGAPTAAMNESDGELLQQASGQFDLPDLQQNDTERTQEENNASNVNTANAALNFIPQNSNDAFLPQGEGEEGDEDRYYKMTAERLTAYDRDGKEVAQVASKRDDPNKPPIGSDEWVRWRKDNHKEVERRRRETINEGINELAKVVPNCQKNKGSVLQKTIEYITELRETLQENAQKWEFEKLVTEQTINSLSEKLQKSWHEKEAWKKIAKEAGVDVDDVTLNIGGSESEDEEGQDAEHAQNENQQSAG